jgi:hypothetical protein
VHQFQIGLQFSNQKCLKITPNGEQKTKKTNSFEEKNKINNWRANFLAKLSNVYHAKLFIFLIDLMTK